MQVLVGVVSLVLVAAITPGPNNVVVMAAAARSGLAAALPVIAALVAGSLALLAVVSTGAGALLAAEPRLRTLVTLAGCAFLVWLGAGMLRGTSGRRQAVASRGVAMPAGSALALVAFPFLNPKGWVTVITATSAAPGVPWWQLAAVFTIVPAICLLLWSLLGSALSGLLARPAAAARFDRIMGVLLIASALALALDA